MPELLTKLEEMSELIYNKMDDLLPVVKKGRVGESHIAKAMRYSTLASGKRMRPFLVMASANLFGVNEISALRVASAIEFVHAYSLIHDDLPALDNDDMRRGQPSCHIMFDEATAILTGDALLTLAFEVLAHPDTHPDSTVRADLTLLFAEACGAKGMIGGQMIDMISERRELNIEEITRLQRLKTGALFAISCEAGAILGKTSRSIRTALRGYAHDMGLVFQITDDLLDAEVGVEDALEGERQDKSAEKGTYISVMGVKKARIQAEILTNQAIKHLDIFDKRADVLRELAKFILERKH